MPVIVRPPGRPLPPNHPFASPTIVIGMKRPTPGKQQGSTPGRCPGLGCCAGQVRTLYTEGLTDFLDVLEMQRTWLANQRELMRTEAALAQADVALFEAMGLIGNEDTFTQRY